ncbi:hypothetical protein SteCoe_3463 [Stentor coeruleus]|uniref:Ion transport domain-containing protein n=1 Tax=Stentor coeruleus TaxID=5963 RepID=A0A1R2CWZ8_9CILI|nr:hypothetical protein SteCoe_3463 [Stentor coeruleus]
MINFSDFRSLVNELDSRAAKEIMTFSFANNIVVPSDEQTIIFSTEKGISMCSKAKTEVTNSRKLIENQVTAFVYSEHRSVFYLADHKGILHFICSHEFKEQNTLQLHQSKVQRMALSFDELVLYSCSKNSEVKMLDLETFTIKLLYTHDNQQIWTMDLSPDGELIATSGAKVLKFYLIMEEKIISSLDIGEDIIICLKFSPDSKKLVTGDDKGKVKLWNVGNFEAVEYVGHSSQVCKVAFGEKCFATGGNDQLIKIWTENPNLDPIVIKAKSNIIDIVIDKDTLYFSIMNQISYLKMPTFNPEYCLKKHSGQIYQLLFSSKKKLVFSISNEDKAIFMWNIEELTFFGTLFNDSIAKCMCLSTDQKFIYVSLHNKCVKRWQIEGNFLSEDFFKSEYSVSSIVCTKDNNYLVSIDTMCKCIVRNTLDASILWSFSNHKISGLLVDVTNYSNVLISVGSDHTVFIYDLRIGEKIGKMEWPKEEARKVRISFDDRLVALATVSSEVYVWNIHRQNCIFKITADNYKCSDVNFTQDNKYLLILTYDHEGSKLIFYTLNGFYLITTMAISNICNSFQLINDENFIVFGNGSDLYFKENPLKLKTFSISSHHSIYPLDFCKYISDLSKGFNIPHQAEMDEYTLFPSQINSLHFYAYYNLSSHLQQALETSNSTYISCNSQDIMSISIQKGLFDNIKIILAHVLKNLKIDPYSACFLENSFANLTKESCVELEALYNEIFFKSSDKTLPKFLETEDFIEKSECFEINPDFMVFDKKIESHPVVFYQSGIRIHCEIGSERSIEYLESLLSTGNQEIFRSKLVENILKDKWKQVRWFAYSYAGLYLCYLVFLCLFVLVNTEFYRIVLIVLNVFLVFYELYQLLMTFRTYFTELWNWLDVIRLVLFIVYFSLTTPHETLLFFLNLISWARGVTYFRIFTGTRYMVNLLTQVGKDIFAFLVILFYFTIAFTFMMLSLTGNQDGYSGIFKIQNIYLLNLGDFNARNIEDSWEWACFIVASMINFLVMVNLLISIIADTHDKVQAFRDIADRREMAEMVLEIENLMVWRRSWNVATYLHLVSSENTENLEDAWQGKVRELQVKISGMEGFIKGQFNALDLKMTDLKSDLSYIKSTIDEIKSSKN